MTDADEGAGNPALPPLHNAWLATLTGIRDPQSEPKATCHDCVMCGGIDRSGSQVTFSPAVKCCSYVPHLANFLVGRSLAGPGHAGVAARIARRAGATPLGLGLSHADIRRVVEAQSGFGHSAAVVCPHFVESTQGCGIWQTRNAVCSTWFCKHDRGAVTQAYWHAVRDLLMAAEEGVARYCLTRAGLPDQQVRAVLDHRASVRDTIGRANAGEALTDLGAEDETSDWYERMWGAWAGREKDWFLGCAESVAALSDDDLRRTVDGGERLVRSVHERAADLTRHEVPLGLAFRPGPGSEATPDVLRLVGYSPFDPLLLPAALLPDLQRLDGRAGGGDDPVLDADLLGRLLDFEVAAAPEH